MHLKTGEICSLTNLPLPTLTRWIHTGLVIPATRGHAGQGGSHLFSIQQCVGLCIVAALSESVGCKGVVAGEIIRGCERASGDDVDAWFTGVLNAYQEERAAAARAKATLLGDLSGHLAMATAEKLYRLRDFYLARKGRGDRPPEPRAGTYRWSPLAALETSKLTARPKPKKT
jgi:hypothetical protein